jgi:hypothetical protein
LSVARDSTSSRAMSGRFFVFFRAIDRRGDARRRGRGRRRALENEAPESAANRTPTKERMWSVFHFKRYGISWLKRAKEWILNRAVKLLARGAQ